MYTASDLKKGLRLKIDNEPYLITEFNFVKPGKGQALYRTKLKNMITGSQFERSFRSVDTFESADLREKKMQYLYKEGNKYCFMDNETYEQIYLTEVQMDDAKNFLIDNIEVEILLFEDRLEFTERPVPGPPRRRLPLPLYYPFFLFQNDQFMFFFFGICMQIHPRQMSFEKIDQNITQRF